jgi:hypothetical protein
MELLLEYCVIDYLEQFVNKKLFIKTVLLYASLKHSLSEGKAQCIVSKWQVEILIWRKAVWLGKKSAFYV